MSSWDVPGSLWQWNTLPCFTCKLAFDMFRGKAETTRHVENCVPINIHFSFPLPGSSVDLKVLMKTIYLQKGFLSWAYYHKNSTETVQTSETNSFPAQKIDSARTCHGLRDIFSLLGHMEPQHLANEWPPLRAPFKPDASSCSLSLPTTFFCSESPHTRCCLSSANQLWSIWGRRARERLQPCTANARHTAPLRETVWRETTARVLH